MLNAADIFIRVPLADHVKVGPKQLTQNMSATIVNRLVKLYAGKCSHHGYIRTGSIELITYSFGHVMDVTLNGDVDYYVTYFAQVCNPAIGSTVKAKVVNQNMFGILAESGIDNTPILEIIISNLSLSENNDNANDSININTIKRGDIINVEIVGKRFELDDTKMTIVGKVVPNTKEKRELEIAVKVGGEDAGDEVDADIVGGEDDDVDDDDDVAAVGGEDEEDVDAATLGADADPDADADAVEADADVESSFGGDSFDGGDDFSSVASSGGDDVVEDN